MIGETFGQWLKARRAALGLTLRDVEQITGGVVSNAALSQIETGKTSRPSIVIAAQLAAAYALPAEEVFERARNGGKLPPPPMFCEACGQMIRGPGTNPERKTSVENRKNFSAGTAGERGPGGAG